MQATTFTTVQLAELRSSYATLPKRMPVEYADRMLALLDACSPEMVKQLSKAGIKFLSAAALGRVMRAKHGL